MKQTILEAERIALLRGDIVISFFFNGRGGAVEKSPNSLFRTLIHHLLEPLKAKSLPPHSALTAYRLKRDTQTTVTWHLEDLKVLFQEICLDLSSVRLIIFLDALDEIQEEDRNSASEIIRYFHDITIELAKAQSTTKLCVCFSSRPIESIGLWWPEHYVKFSMQDENREDINTYVQNTLESLQRFTGGIDLQQLGKKIIARADGVFLWVSLVMQDTLIRVQNATQLELEQQLYSVPTELNHLYRQLLQQIPVESRKEALRMFRVVLFSEIPLSIEDFRIAMSAVRAPCFKSFADVHEATDVVQTWSRMQYRIHFHTKGLLESKGVGDTSEDSKDGSNRIVQLLHQSVKDFLLSDDGLRVFGIRSHDDLERDSHGYILEACIKTLIMAAGAVIDFGLAFPLQKSDSLDELYSRSPFLVYATENWTFHAQKSSVEAQAYAMKLFLDQSNHVLEFWKHKTDYHPSISLLAIAINSGLPECVKYLLETKAANAGSIDDSMEDIVDQGIAGLICAGVREDKTLELLLEWCRQAGGAADCSVNVLQYVSLQGDYDAFREVLELGATLEDQGGPLGTCLIATIAGSEVFSRGKPMIIHYILGKAPELVLADSPPAEWDRHYPFPNPLEIAAGFNRMYCFTLVLKTMIELNAYNLVNPINLLNISVSQKNTGTMGLVLRKLGNHLLVHEIRKIANEAL